MEQERISQRMKPNKLVVATILGLAYVGYVGNNIRELGDLREQLGSSTVRRTEIERDRDWYWKQKNKQTYWKIAQSDGVSRDQFEDFVKDRIVKAVKSYKQKLGIK